jgi:sugar phosphate permease
MGKSSIVNRLKQLSRYAGQLWTLRAELGYSATDIAALNTALLIRLGLGQVFHGNLSGMAGDRWMFPVGAALSLGANWTFRFIPSAARRSGCAVSPLV